MILNRSDVIFVEVGRSDNVDMYLRRIWKYFTDSYIFMVVYRDFARAQVETTHENSRQAAPRA